MRYSPHHTVHEIYSENTTRVYLCQLSIQAQCKLMKNIGLAERALWCVSVDDDIFPLSPNKQNIPPNMNRPVSLNAYIFHQDAAR